MKQRTKNILVTTAATLAIGTGAWVTGWPYDSTADAPPFDSGYLDLRPEEVKTPSPTPTIVSDDHPDFNCLTMGNKICGPGVLEEHPDGFVNRP